MQEKVFAFLTDPAVHPHVHRIDTHAASIFLEGDRALKIKRAVRFPYLDYSTLAKRKAACDEEIRINHPLAPQIYHRVVPITRNNAGSLDIDGKGTPVEYAIEMTRFDERRTIWQKPVHSIPIWLTLLRMRSRHPTPSRRPRRRSPGSSRFRDSSRAIPRRSEPPPAMQKAPSMSSRKRLCPRSPESASC